MNTQHLISLASFKGGVGKTTVAVHLAGFLAARAATCVVDGDRTRNATFWHAGGHLRSAVISPSSIAREGRKYEFIITDTRGGLDDEDLFEVAEASDLLILPSSVEMLSLDAMRQTAEALEAKGYLDKTRVLLTMVRSKVKESQAREVLLALGLKVMDPSVRLAEACKDATSRQVLVNEIKSGEAVWGDFCAVGEAVLERLEESRG